MPEPAGLAPPRPVVTVLVGDGSAAGHPPGLVERVGADAELRFATADTLADTLPGADVLLTWDFLSTAVPGAWHAADRVRWVHTASAGIDKVAFPALLASDAALTNSRGVFDRPIAEYVLGLVLAFAKDLPRTVRLQDERTWRHRESESVTGQVAVVIGGGPIGHAIAGLLRAVGMHVELVGRRAADGVHAFDALDGLLPRADHLVLAAPLTEATRGMLGKTRLALLPPAARVINVGRGGLVVEADLVEALREGRLAGAALDVVETEPLPADSPLWTLPNVIVSPHMSGDVVGWREMLVELFCDNLTRFRAGAPLRNVVDKELGYVPS